MNCPECHHPLVGSPETCPKCGKALNVPLPGESELESTPIQPPESKQRHGCLTAYLIFMIIASSGTALVYLFGSEGLQEINPAIPGWTYPILIAGSVFTLVFAIALFQWKKWGFYGFAFSAIGIFFIHLTAGLGVLASVSGLIGIPLLYGVLHIGKERKGWSQLE